MSLCSNFFYRVIFTTRLMSVSYLASFIHTKNTFPGDHVDITCSNLRISPVDDRCSLIADTLLVTVIYAYGVLL